MATQNKVVQGIIITDSEYAVLQSLYNNHYGDHGSCTWAWAVNHSEKPSGIEGKALSGVVGSLCKKGLYKADNCKGNDAGLWSTELGDEVMAELFGQGSK